MLARDWYITSTPSFTRITKPSLFLVRDLYGEREAEPVGPEGETGLDRVDGE